MTILEAFDKVMHSFAWLYIVLGFVAFPFAKKYANEGKIFMAYFCAGMSLAFMLIVGFYIFRLILGYTYGHQQIVLATK